MMMFVIYGQPRTKKNSQQIVFNKKTGRQFVKQSDAYKGYEKEAIRQLTQMGLNDTLIDYPVNIACKFYRGDRRRVDLTNLLEAIDDVMVKARLLEDDNCNIVVTHDGSIVLYDKEKPRTVVTITRREAEGDSDIR